MRRVAILFLLLAACADHRLPMTESAAYLDQLDAHYAANARELPHWGVLDHNRGIQADKRNPYPYDPRVAHEVYRTRCAPCHGSHGEGAHNGWSAYGNEVTGPPLDRPDIRNEYSEGEVHYVVSGTWRWMVSLGPMTDEERWQVAQKLKLGDW